MLRSIPFRRTTSGTRSLDFLVLGVPRSGTTALVNSINLHPDVFCGMELLQVSDRHTRLRYPDSFLSLARKLTPNQQRSLAQLTTTKTNPLRLGNKMPRYYLHLDSLLDTLKSAKIVWLYRSPSAFCASWNRRARNREDQLWDRGQTGVFGVLESLVCVKMLSTLDRSVLVVPYDAFFFENPNAICDLFDYLDVPLAEAERRRFVGRIFDRVAVKRRDNSTTEVEDEMLAAMQYEQLDQLMGRQTVFELASIADSLSDYVRRVEAPARERFRQLASGFSHEERDYLEAWKTMPGIRDFLSPRRRWWRAFR